MAKLVNLTPHRVVLCDANAQPLLAALEREQHPMLKHCLSPDTGPQGVVRDAAGQVAGVRRFIAVPTG